MPTNKGVRAMLAANEPWNEGKVGKHLQTDGHLIMQPKWDGMRCLFDGKGGAAMSRAWKPLGSRYLQEFAYENSYWIHGFDSEVFAGHEYDPTSFRVAMSKIRAGEGSPTFTVVLYDDWNSSRVYAERRLDLLARLSSKAGQSSQASDTPQLVINGGRPGCEYSAKLVFTEQRQVTNLDEVYSYESELLAAGHEGGILRRAGSLYKYNRATLSGGQLIKLKRWVDAEAVIEAVEPRFVNNNEPTIDARGYQVRSAHSENLVPIEQVGCFRVALVEDLEIKFGIGSFLGWDHSYLQYLWTIREKLPGQIIKFKHQGYGGGYDKPRQPIGLGWRDPADLG